MSTGGACLPDEKFMHINILELKAILLALKSFVKTRHKHIKIMSDNTNINTQFGKYAAFRPNPGAMYIDAFSIDWFDLKFYAFPPISVIPRVLAKVKQDSAEGIIVVPFWPTQIWYPVMLKMLVSTPILLNSRKSLLVLSQTPNLVHPMWKKMNMLVVHL